MVCGLTHTFYACGLGVLVCAWLSETRFELRKFACSCGSFKKTTMWFWIDYDDGQLGKKEEKKIPRRSLEYTPPGARRLKLGM